MITVARRSPMRQLSKFVQLDHACLGGERNGGNPGARVGEQASLLGGGSGRWDRDHPTYYPAIEPVRSFDGASIKDWQRQKETLQPAGPRGTVRPVAAFACTSAE
ncbi:hypothetical protein [Metallibacterium scheffleri]